jgi:hypothetical protein
VGTNFGNGLRRNPKQKRGDNIKTDFREAICEDGRWTELTQDHGALQY